MSSTAILLIERWMRTRDAQAFNEIVMRYSALVYGTCRRVLRNHADAEDVTQDCFLHLARTDSPPRRSLGGWLHALATHRALDRLKSKVRRRRREASFAASREPAATSDWDGVQKCVDEAIEALPKDLRSLIVAHFLEQRTQESIARELGLSRQTVTYRISKGIEKVRRKLERRGIAVVLTSLSTMLSTKLVEAAPASLKASLGKLALAGAGTAAAGTAGTATTTLGVLGEIGAMYKIAMAAGIAVVLMLIIGYGLSPREEVVSSAPGDGVGAPAVTTNADGGAGEGLATADSVAEETALQVETPAAPVDRDRMIRGRVVDPDGQVVAAASVAAGEKGGEKLVEVAADASGVFELELLEAGSYVVCAFKDGVGLGAGYEVETGGEELAIQLEPLGSVSGRVSDKETGEGIDDLEIRLSYFGEFDRQDRQRARAFTWLDIGRSREPERSPGGGYRFVNLLAARYLFKLKVEGAHYVVPGVFGQPFIDLTLIKGEVRKGFNFALERAGAVSGHVFDPDGEPLSGARANISSSKHSFSSPPSVKTDDDGGYRFGGLAVGGSYAVIVDHEGLAQSHSETITLPTPREIAGLDVHMSEGHTVFGRVVDGQGQGIPDVRFRLGKEQWSSIRAHGREETVTAEDGSFRIERVGPGKYSLVPRADGYESWSARSLTMPADRDLEDLVFVLKRKAEGFVSGRVTDAEGKPLAGIRMTIGNDRRGPHVQGSAETDKDGLYRFDEIGKAKTFMVGVHTQDYCYQELEQVLLNATDVDFALDRFASVIGRVVDDATGEPVTDFELRSTSYRNRPTGIPSEHWIPLHSDEGEFVLDDIELPESEIDVRAEGYAPFVTERIKIQPEETAEVEVRLRKGASIAGRIVDAVTGKPLPGVRVRVYAQHYFHNMLLTDRREGLTRGFQALITTDEEGRYEFTGLSVEKELDLVAWRDGLGTQVISRLRPPRQLRLRMYPEGRLVAEVRNGPEPVKTILVAVSLNEQLYGADYWHGLWTSEQGLVVHTGLRPGRYKVFVRMREGESLGRLSQEIRAGETAELKIDLEDLEKRFARISGIVKVVSEYVSLRLSSAGEPKKTLDSTFCTAKKTSFRFGGIPPGEYILRASQGESEHSTDQKVTLLAGQELKVEIELRE